MKNKPTESEVVSELKKLNFSEEKAKKMLQEYYYRYDNAELESAQDIASQIESDWLDED
jgi:hypothetical protein